MILTINNADWPNAATEIKVCYIHDHGLSPELGLLLGTMRDVW